MSSHLKKPITCLFVLVCFVSCMFWLQWQPPSISANQTRTSAGSAQQPQESSSFPLHEVWQEVPRVFVSGKLPTALPQSYRRLRLQREAFQQILAQAPLQREPEAEHRRVAVSFPLPDGGFARFRMAESPVMEPALAARFPEIRSYQGVGVDDPTATLRVTQTPTEIHVMMVTAQGTVYLKPVHGTGEPVYLAYYGQDVPVDVNQIGCQVTPEMEREAQIAAPDSYQETDPDPSGLPTAIPHRTFRLAVATTGEFTQSIGTGSLSEVMAEINRYVNAANLVYSRELNLDFLLVAGNENLIFSDPATDPYSGGLANKAGQNQTTINGIVGYQNYDIGHLLDTGGGGIGFIGLVCDATNKAKGVTGGDPIAFMHELGHQLGALHTFNSTTGNCNGNRNGISSYEVGGGTTIMSYGGACSPETVQHQRDNYFHIDSLERIRTRLSPSNTDCSIRGTSNSNPSVTVPVSYKIPYQTPFTLTATSASDSDLGTGQLTYCWEEFDLGTASPPQTDDGGRPLFRSFSPTISPARTFPQLSDILSNTTTFGELLPTTARTMKFRCTVRDGQGGFNYGLTKVTTVVTSSIFRITSFNTATVVWNGSTTKTVTWNHAGTNTTPISCAQVKISLSTDGGQTFPYVLAASTPNDGSQQVTVPSGLSSTQARIKVEAVNNIFFDISDVNFTVTP